MNLAKKLPSAEILRSLLSYRPEDGALIWLLREGSPGSFNEKHAGKVAGRINPAGYVRIKINGSMYSGHRIVWAMHFGEPAADIEIDHINHARSDNRIENLRVTRRSENQWNQRVRVGCGTSDFKGVSWVSRDQRWLAQIMEGGKRRHIGYFKNESEAAAAYDLVALKSRGEYAHVNGAACHGI